MNEAIPSASLGTTLMTILIALGILCVLAFSIISRRGPWELETPGLLARLRKRRERILRAIKDAEFERESGALAVEEFRGLRNRLKLRAIQVTKDLERVRKARFKSLFGKGRGATPSQKKHIEDLVSKRLEKLIGSHPAPSKGGSP